MKKNKIEIKSILFALLLSFVIISIGYFAPKVDVKESFDSAKESLQETIRSIENRISILGYQVAAFVMPRYPQRLGYLVSEILALNEELIPLIESMEVEVGECDCKYTISQCIPSSDFFCESAPVIGDPCPNRRVIGSNQADLRAKLDQLIYVYTLLKTETELGLPRELNALKEAGREDIAQDIEEGVQGVLEEAEKIIGFGSDAYSLPDEIHCFSTCSVFFIEACVALGEKQEHARLDFSVKMELEDLDLGQIRISEVDLGLPKEIALPSFGNLSSFDIYGPKTTFTRKTLAGIDVDLEVAEKAVIFLEVPRLPSLPEPPIIRLGCPDFEIYSYEIEEVDMSETVEDVETHWYLRTYEWLSDQCWKFADMRDAYGSPTIKGFGEKGFIGCVEPETIHLAVLEECEKSWHTYAEYDDGSFKITIPPHPIDDAWLGHDGWHSFWWDHWNQTIDIERRDPETREWVDRRISTPWREIWSDFWPSTWDRFWQEEESLLNEIVDIWNDHGGTHNFFLEVYQLQAWQRIGVQPRTIEVLEAINMFATSEDMVREIWRSYWQDYWHMHSIYFWRNSWEMLWEGHWQEYWKKYFQHHVEKNRRPEFGEDALTDQGWDEKWSADWRTNWRRYWEDDDGEGPWRDYWDEYWEEYWATYNENYWDDYFEQNEDFFLGDPDPDTRTPTAPIPHFPKPPPYSPLAVMDPDYALRERTSGIPRPLRICQMTTTEGAANACADLYRLGLPDQALLDYFQEVVENNMDPEQVVTVWRQWKALAESNPFLYNRETPLALMIKASLTVWQEIGIVDASFATLISQLFIAENTEEVERIWDVYWAQNRHEHWLKFLRDERGTENVPDSCYTNTITAIEARCQELKDLNMAAVPEACRILPILTREFSAPDEVVYEIDPHDAPAQIIGDYPSSKIGCEIKAPSIPKIPLSRLSVEIPNIILGTFSIPPFIRVTLPSFYFENLVFPDIELCNLDNCHFVFPSLDFRIPVVDLPIIEVPPIKLGEITARGSDGVMLDYYLPDLELPSFRLPAFALNFDFRPPTLPEIMMPKLEIPGITIPKPKLTYHYKGVQNLNDVITALLWTFIKNLFGIRLPVTDTCISAQLSPRIIPLVYNFGEYRFYWPRFPEIPEIEFCRNINEYCLTMRSLLQDVVDKVEEIERKFNNLVYTEVQSRLDEAAEIIKIEVEGYIEEVVLEEMRKQIIEDVRRQIEEGREIITIDPGRYTHPEIDLGELLYEELGMEHVIEIDWEEYLTIPLTSAIEYDLPSIPLSKLNYERDFTIEGPGLQRPFARIDIDHGQGCEPLPPEEANPFELFIHEKIIGNLIKIDEAMEDLIHASQKVLYWLR